MSPPTYDNLPTPEQAHDALALVHRTEQQAFRPTPLRLRSLLATSAFVGLICGGIGSGGLWRFTIVNALAAMPLPWLAGAVVGAALTLVVALTGNWYYLRAYQRWSAESA